MPWDNSKIGGVWFSLLSVNKGGAYLDAAQMGGWQDGVCLYTAKITLLDEPGRRSLR